MTHLLSLALAAAIAFGTVRTREFQTVRGQVQGLTEVFMTLETAQKTIKTAQHYGDILPLEVALLTLIEHLSARVETLEAQVQNLRKDLNE